MAILYNHDHENEIIFFAETNFRNARRKFGIKTDDRRRHFYCLGKTGMGKTTLLENMIIADIKAGHGVGVVDPHGDLAERILDFIPSYRINDVVYFNPADIDWPIGFNILETINPERKHLVASGLMGVFKKIWPDVWSARMEYILSNAVLALLDYPGSTLLGINRLLVDKEFRKRVISCIKDPVVKAFWVDEFARYHDRFQVEAIAPIQNKVGQFLSASVIRNIVAQVRSTIDIHDIMDSGKIFIMNLSKGRIGEDNSRLLGGMLITRLQLAAMERVNIPEEDRRDFYLYVDEFQNFATESFANILSEARKYRLNLILAHQYIAQLDENVRAAIFGNVGTIVVFRVGAADAEFLVNEFAPYFTIEDLVNLKKYDIYLKLMINGMASKPFSATTLPPAHTPEGHKEKIIRISRERYAERREVIEDKILRWSGFGLPEKGEVSPKKESKPLSSPTPQIDTSLKGSTQTKKTQVFPKPKISTPEQKFIQPFKSFFQSQKIIFEKKPKSDFAQQEKEQEAAKEKISSPQPETKPIFLVKEEKPSPPPNSGLKPEKSQENVLEKAQAIISSEKESQKNLTVQKEELEELFKGSVDFEDQTKSNPA